MALNCFQQCLVRNLLSTFLSLSHLYIELLAVPQSDVKEMVTPSIMDDYYSPWSPLYLNTPQDSTMDTPLFHYLDESQMLVDPDAPPLFPSFSERENPQEPVAEPKPLLERQPSGISPVVDTPPLLVLSDMSDTDSTWIFPFSTPLNHSGRCFIATLQLRDNISEERPLRERTRTLRCLSCRIRHLNLKGQ